ncbi:MAG TPA: 2-amino-4-hydroxy-6-hydroxymethyldihydropteridine diphosphokinase [Thermomicrobiales bacterium]
MAIAYIALGSNLGDRLQHLRDAVTALGELGEVEAVSSVYETAPVGYLDQPSFLNAVLRLRTELSPRDLLNQLMEIERRGGRVRTFQNAPRTLDLDVLLYDGQIIDTPDLTVPHPRMHERGFVLVPLADIDPELVHPRLGASVADLLRALGPTPDVQPIPDRIDAE